MARTRRTLSPQERRLAEALRAIRPTLTGLKTPEGRTPPDEAMAQVAWYGTVRVARDAMFDGWQTAEWGSALSAAQDEWDVAVGWHEQPETFEQLMARKAQTA